MSGQSDRPVNTPPNYSSKLELFLTTRWPRFLSVISQTWKLNSFIKSKHLPRITVYWIFKPSLILIGSYLFRSVIGAIAVFQQELLKPLQCFCFLRRFCVWQTGGNVFIQQHLYWNICIGFWSIGQIFRGNCPTEPISAKMREETTLSCRSIIWTVYLHPSPVPLAVSVCSQNSRGLWETCLCVE